MTEAEDKKQERFRMTGYDGEEITERHLNRKEVLQLDPDDVDFHWDQAFGKAFIRKSNVWGK